PSSRPAAWSRSGAPLAAEGLRRLLPNGTTSAGVTGLSHVLGPAPGVLAAARAQAARARRVPGSARTTRRAARPEGWDCRPRPRPPSGDVIRNQVVARVGVEDGADPLRRLVDVPIRGVLLAALDHQVLEEMGHAILLGQLRAGPGVKGHQDRGRARPGGRDAV